MHNLKYLYKNYLIPLKIPALWLVIKNNLIDIDNINLEHYDSDELFIIKEVFLKYDIFHSKYYTKDNPYELDIVIFYLSEGKYEISCSLFKKKKELFIMEKEYHSLEELINALNNLHLNILYEIDDAVNTKNYNRLANCFD